MNYYVSQYTSVGFSGAYVEDLEAANRLVDDSHVAYYSKITDSDGNVVREVEKPFFVKRGVLLTDNYTGEKFWCPKCFASEAEAISACPGQPIIELHDKLDYLDLA